MKNLFIGAMLILTSSVGSCFDPPKESVYIHTSMKVLRVGKTVGWLNPECEVLVQSPKGPRSIRLPDEALCGLLKEGDSVTVTIDRIYDAAFITAMAAEKTINEN